MHFLGLSKFENVWGHAPTLQGIRGFTANAHYSHLKYHFQSKAASFALVHVPSFALFFFGKTILSTSWIFMHFESLVRGEFPLVESSTYLIQNYSYNFVNRQRPLTSSVQKSSKTAFELRLSHRICQNKQPIKYLIHD